MQYLLLLLSLCCCSHVSHALVPTMKGGEVDFKTCRHAVPHNGAPHMLHQMEHGETHDGGRKLLQTGDCLWRPTSEQCVLPPVEIFSLIARSKRPIARFVTTDYKCSTETEEEACEKVGYCFWNTENSVCSYLDWSLRHGDSPCLKKAPGIFRSLTARGKCALEKTESSCDAVKDCRWDASDEECDVDILLIVFGASGDAFREATRQLLSNMTLAAAQKFQQQFDASEENFEWKDVLKLEVAAEDCLSEDLHPTICSYLQKIVMELLPPLFYCNGEYGEGKDEECTADPLCEVDDGRCTASSSVADDAVTKTSLELETTSEYPKELWTTALTCASQSTEDACSGRKNCVWDSSEPSCEMSPTFLFSFLSEGGDKKDELCDYLSALASIPCYDISEEKSCIAEEQCEYAEGECDETTEVGLGNILGKDSDLFMEWMELNEKCEEKKSQETCEA